VGWVSIPLVLLVAAVFGLVLGVEPVPSFFFQCLWWPFILLMDGLNRRRGHSLIRGRVRRFLWLCFGSVVFWTLFEAINLRLGNWYYVMVQTDRPARWLAGAVAFATVLPGTLVVLAWVEGRGWLSRVKVAPLRFSPAKERACLALGVACLMLPLLWPNLFFPLTWGSFVFLIEPWNRRHAEASFLRDLERGEAGPFCRTLLTGLLCGLVWESGNFWARTRWIYTVPGFEELKLFEMPLLGFLGFPPFAVECLVVVRCAETLRRSLASRRAAVRRAVAGAALVAGTAGTLLIFELADEITTDSHYIPVAELEVLPPAWRRPLSEGGLSTPERLVAALVTPAGRARWSARTRLAERELAEAHDRVALVVHRGLGQRRARQLAALGIRDLQGLSRWSPGPLAAALRERTDARDDRFLERRVRAWLQGLEP
jgi:hypothetical protein